MLLLTLFFYITLTTAKKNIQRYQKSRFEKWFEQNEIDIFKPRENFTTCEEFLEYTPFNITQVLNVTWQAFYIWADAKHIDQDYSDLYLNFQLPHAMLVQRYRELLSKKFETINWNATELYLQINVAFSGVLVATYLSGLYDSIPTTAFEDTYDSTMYNRVALKIVKPHYLGMMDCSYRQLIAYAPVGQIPSEQEIESVAKMFKFKCTSGYGMSVYELKKLKRQEEIQQQTEKHGASGEDVDLVYDDLNGNNEEHWLE